MKTPIIIRKARSTDSEKIWGILKRINSGGDAFSFDPRSSKKAMLDYWLGKDKYVYVAAEGKEVVGTFYIRDNQPGLASHIANAAYAVSPDARGNPAARW